MTVAIVGGMDRLAEHYAQLANEHQDVEVRVFNRYRPGLAHTIMEADGIILFTNLVSHQAAREVYRLARKRGNTIICSHSAGVSSARRCLAELTAAAAACSNCDDPCARARGRKG